MGHDPRRQTTRPTTVRKGGRRIKVSSRSQRTPFRGGFNLRELSARAQSLGLSIPDFLSLSQQEREQGASLIGSGRFGIERLSRFGTGVDDDGLDSLDLSGVNLFGDGGGGGGGFGGTRESALLAQQQALELLSQEQAFATAEAEKARQFEREQELGRLRADRQRIFTDLLGTDPVRAVLFAMGIGEGTGEFAGLEPLKLPSSAPTGRETEQALGGLVGRKVGIGESGVTGLGSVSQAAAAFGGQAGGAGGDIADQQKLLLSGFGVGATRGKGRPGQSREEILRKISAATPRGVL